MNNKIKWVLPLGTGLNWLQSMNKSIADIEKFIQKEMDDQDTENIIVGGFSQGGAVAPLVAKLYGKTYSKIKGVISLSSRVLDEFHE